MKIGVKNNDGQIKYLAKLKITVDGRVNEADIIGALFGQTEGLFEDNFDFKTLQQQGRIGRIVLNLSKEGNKVKGNIELPCDLKKVEISILVATLESIDRVGPCSTKIEFQDIVDVRQEKRKEIEQRAIDILKKMEMKPHFKTIEKRVLKKATVNQLITYGQDKLVAGSGILTEEEIILVEGKADVTLLFRHGIANTIELRGYNNSYPTIKKLCKSKTVTAFLDGDRGGDILLKSLVTDLSIDYVARAPKKREVENLEEEEIHQALAKRVRLSDAQFFTEDGTVETFLSTCQKKHPHRSSTTVEAKVASKQKVRVTPATKQEHVNKSPQVAPKLKSRYKNAPKEVKSKNIENAPKEAKLKNIENAPKEAKLKNIENAPKEAKLKNIENASKEVKSKNIKNAPKEAKPKRTEQVTTKAKKQQTTKVKKQQTAKVKKQQTTKTKKQHEAKNLKGETSARSSRYVKDPIKGKVKDPIEGKVKGPIKRKTREKFVNSERREARQFKTGNGRQKFRGRNSRPKRSVNIPEALLSQIKKIKHTFKTVFFDRDYNQISSVPTSEAYAYLQKNEASSVVIDGVVTQRMVELAAKRKMQYIIGAVLGEEKFTIDFKKLVISNYPR